MHWHVTPNAGTAVLAAGGLGGGRAGIGGGALASALAWSIRIAPGSRFRADNVRLAPSFGKTALVCAGA